MWSATPGGVGDSIATDPGRMVYIATVFLVTDPNGQSVPLLVGYGTSATPPR